MSNVKWQMADVKWQMSNVKKSLRLEPATLTILHSRMSESSTRNFYILISKTQDMAQHGIAFCGHLY